MKSQNKMLNLTSQIQKLAKGLNKFSLSDILQLVPEKEKTVNNVLKDLEAESVIKKVSGTEYLYTKIREILPNVTKQNMPTISHTFSDNQWLTMDEVCELTGELRETVRRKCKRQTYVSKYTKKGRFKEYLINKNSIDITKIKASSKRFSFSFENINALPKDTSTTFEKIKVFRSDKEQEYFNSLPPYAQKFVFRYITAFKLAGKLKGAALIKFLKKLADEHPEYKVNYSSYMKNLHLYATGGLKAIVPKYGKSSNKTCIPPDMYEKFKELYLAPNKYSIKKVVAMLKNYGYEEGIIPHYRSFERLLHKEYTVQYIETIKNTPVILPDLEANSFPEKRSRKKNSPIHSRFIDAAQAFLESIENSYTEIDISRRGYIANHLNPYFKNLDINKLTQENIDEFQSIKIAEGYTASSIKRFLSTLTLIMKTNNTNYNHLTFSHKNSLLPPAEKGYLSKNEIENIKRNSLAELWILVLGINPAELLALDYEDIDTKTRLINIDKAFVNNKICKHRKFYKMRKLLMPRILFEKFNLKRTGRIFKDINITNYNQLLNTHVKLLLDKNVHLNIISKNIGMQSLNEFEIRFNFLLPQKLDDNFEIL